MSTGLLNNSGLNGSSMQLCGKSIRDAMGGSGGEETEAGDQQLAPGIGPSCAQTRLRKDEDLASLG